MKHVVVACHDAGGAEMVSSWLKSAPVVSWGAILDGPAEEIFRRKLERVPPARTLHADLLVCGSSARSTFETFTWRAAKKSNIRTAVFLDHWKNYRVRFRTDGGIALPDEVWVTDRYAAALAQKELPRPKIVIKGNPYLKETLAALEATADLRNPQCEQILYVREPGDEYAYNHWMRYNFPNRAWLRERPHPSVAIPETTLVEDIAWANTVVGGDSMAMVVAAAAGRRVISTLSPTTKLTIPSAGIERLYPYGSVSRRRKLRATPGS